MKDLRRSWFERLPLVAVVGWACLLFLHYFPFPQALDPYFLKALGQDLSVGQVDKFLGTWIWFLKNLLGAVLVGLIFARLGARFTGWAGLDRERGPMTRLLEIVLGALGLGLVWTALGLNGLWFEGILKLVLVALTLWALIDLRGKIDEEALPAWWKAQTPGTKGWIAGGGVFAVMALGMAAAPDVFYDGVIYHLSTLQAWLDRHGIVELPANLYTYYPFGGETVLFNGFLLGGSEGAKLLNAAGLILTGVAVGAWVVETAGTWAGAVTWALVMSVPILNVCVWTTSVDVLLALFFLLFLYAMTRFLEGRGRGWAVAAGILGGAALATKYTALPGLALAGGSLWVWKSPRRWDKGWIWMGMAVILLGAPWFLKNLLFQADPLFPYPFLGKGGLPAGYLDNLMADHQASWLGGPSFLEWLQRVLTQDLDKTTAPFLFGFLPLLFFWGKFPAIARFLWVLGWLWVIVGFGLSHQVRMSAPAFVVLLTATGMGLAALPSAGWRRWVAGVVLVFGLLSFLSLGRTAFRFYQIDRVWCGVQSQRDYLTQSPQTTSYFSLAQAAARVVPEGKRLLILGDSRGLYYSNPVVTHSRFDPQVAERLAGQDPDDMRRALREMGVDALVVSGVEGTRLFSDRFPYSMSEPALGNWGVFRERWLQLLYAEGKSGVFLLRDAPVGRKFQRVP